MELVLPGELEGRGLGMVCFLLPPRSSRHRDRKFTLSFRTVSVKCESGCAIPFQHTPMYECATLHSVFILLHLLGLDAVFLSTLKHGQSLFWKAALCRCKSRQGGGAQTRANNYVHSIVQKYRYSPLKMS